MLYFWDLGFWVFYLYTRIRVGLFMSWCRGVVVSWCRGVVVGTMAREEGEPRERSSPQGALTVVQRHWLESKLPFCARRESYFRNN